MSKRNYEGKIIQIVARAPRALIFMLSRDRFRKRNLIPRHYILHILSTNRYMYV